MNIPPSLLNVWTSPRMRPLRAAAKSDVEATFAALGGVASADVVALYGAIGGMQVPDDADWRLWPLDELRQENSNCAGMPIGFSDYLLNCWNFHLEPVNASVSRVLTNYGKGPLVEVASSLEMFLHALATSPLSVLDPGAWAGSRRGAPH